MGIGGEDGIVLVDVFFDYVYLFIVFGDMVDYYVFIFGFVGFLYDDGVGFLWYYCIGKDVCCCFWF